MQMGHVVIHLCYAPGYGEEDAVYNLAYVNPLVCRVDHGRVLGYDNRHGYHHRHFMGEVRRVEFVDYRSLAIRFQEEVRELWRKEDEENG
jgi:hypothetical protein